MWEVSTCLMIITWSLTRAGCGINRADTWLPPGLIIILHVSLTLHTSAWKRCRESGQNRAAPSSCRDARSASEFIAAILASYGGGWGIRSNLITFSHKAPYVDAFQNTHHHTWALLGSHHIYNFNFAFVFVLSLSEITKDCNN